MSSFGMTLVGVFLITMMFIVTIPIDAQEPTDADAGTSHCSANYKETPKIIEELISDEGSMTFTENDGVYTVTRKGDKVEVIKEISDVKLSNFDKHNPSSALFVNDKLYLFSKTKTTVLVYDQMGDRSVFNASTLFSIKLVKDVFIAASASVQRSVTPDEYQTLIVTSDGNIYKYGASLTLLASSPGNVTKKDGRYLVPEEITFVKDNLFHIFWGNYLYKEETLSNKHEDLKTIKPDLSNPNDVHWSSERIGCPPHVYFDAKPSAYTSTATERLLFVPGYVWRIKKSGCSNHDCLSLEPTESGAINAVATIKSNKTHNALVVFHDNIIIFDPVTLKNIVLVTSPGLLSPPFASESNVSNTNDNVTVAQDKTLAAFSRWSKKYNANIVVLFKRDVFITIKISGGGFSAQKHSSVPRSSSEYFNGIPPSPDAADYDASQDAYLFFYGNHYMTIKASGCKWSPDAKVDATITRDANIKGDANNGTKTKTNARSFGDDGIKMIQGNLFKVPDSAYKDIFANTGTDIDTYQKFVSWRERSINPELADAKKKHARKRLTMSILLIIFVIILIIIVSLIIFFYFRKRKPVKKKSKESEVKLVQSSSAKSSNMKSRDSEKLTKKDLLSTAPSKRSKLSFSKSSNVKTYKSPNAPTSAMKTSSPSKTHHHIHHKSSSAPKDVKHSHDNNVSVAKVSPPKETQVAKPAKVASPTDLAKTPTIETTDSFETPKVSQTPTSSKTPNAIGTPVDSKTPSKLPSTGTLSGFKEPKRGRSYGNVSPPPSKEVINIVSKVGKSSSSGSHGSPSTSNKK